MRHGAIILCGTSSRQGLDRARLYFGEQPLLERVAGLIGEVVPPQHIVCVASPNQRLPSLPPLVRAVRDREPDQGPLEGFVAGLAALKTQVDAVYVSACDVPLLAPAFVERMFTELDEHQIVVPVDGEVRFPLAGVYRTSVRVVAERLLKVHERRLAALFEHCRTGEVPVDRLREVDLDLDSLRRYDSQQSLKEAFARTSLLVA